MTFLLGTFSFENFQTICLNLPDRTVWQSTTNRKLFIKFRNINAVSKCQIPKHQLTIFDENFVEIFELTQKPAPQAKI